MTGLKRLDLKELGFNSKEEVALRLLISTLFACADKIESAIVSCHNDKNNKHVDGVPLSKDSHVIESGWALVDELLVIGDADSDIAQ